MKCPNCNQTLLMTEKKGITIDYCPECRGVWLDKGELEKLETMAGPSNANAPFTSEQAYNSQQNRPQHDNDYSKNHNQSANNPHHKKENWLGEIFDF